MDTSLFQIFNQPLRSLSVSFSFVHDRGFISYQDPFPPYARSRFSPVHSASSSRTKALAMTP